MTHGSGSHDVARRLRHELGDSALVERATGVVMEQASASAPEALRTLEDSAAAAGRSLPSHCAVVLAETVRGAPPRGAAVLAPPPSRHRLETSDIEQAGAELATAYGTAIRMTGCEPGAVFRLDRTDAGCFQTGDQELPGTLHFTSEPAAQVVVGVLAAGTVRRDDAGGEERLGVGDVFLTGPPAMVHAATTRDARLQTVTLPPPLLHKVADQLPDETYPLTFTALRAASRDLAEHWRATAGYTAALLERPECATPLVVANAAQLLAATALAVFPNTASASSHALHDGGDATPATVRRATAFMDEHADREISLTDIAGAAFVTPRALQYAFRRHLGTTPLAYLRDVRLRHAHHDLMDADPALTTVTEIAARWGFLHPGRFATRYQDLYHCPPSSTLHA